MSAPVDTMPHSLEVERAVIAACLDGRSKQAMPIAREHIDHPGMFYARDHRIVWQACLDLDDAAAPVDGGTVADLLKRTRFHACLERLRAQEEALAEDLDAAGRAAVRAKYRRMADDACEFDDSALAAIGGHNAITDLAMAYAPAAGLARGAAQVADYHAKRRLITRMEALAGETRRTTKTAAEVAEAIIAVAARQTASGSVDSSAADGLAQALAEHDAVASGARPARLGSWGIAGLDYLVPLAPGRMIVLSGPKKGGKTSLAIGAAHATATALGPQSAGILSLEIDAKDIGAVLAARLIGVPKGAVLGGDLTARQMEQARQIERDLRAADIAIRDRADDARLGAIVAWIRRRHQRTSGRLAVVVLDYVQLIGRGERETEYEAISRATRTIKQLCRQLGICVLLLSQTNRESTKAGRDAATGQLGPSPEPQLSDLHGSGSIEADCDAAVMLWRREVAANGDRHMTAKVAANRHGPEGLVELTFQGSRGQRFVAQEPAAPDPSRLARSEAAPSDSEDHFR